MPESRAEKSFKDTWKSAARILLTLLTSVLTAGSTIVTRAGLLDGGPALDLAERSRELTALAFVENYLKFNVGVAGQPAIFILQPPVFGDAAPARQIARFHAFWSDVELTATSLHRIGMQNAVESATVCEVESTLDQNAIDAAEQMIRTPIVEASWDFDPLLDRARKLGLIGAELKDASLSQLAATASLSTPTMMFVTDLAERIRKEPVRWQCSAETSYTLSSYAKQKTESQDRAVHDLAYANFVRAIDKGGSTRRLSSLTVQQFENYARKRREELAAVVHNVQGERTVQVEKWLPEFSLRVWLNLFPLGVAAAYLLWGAVVDSLRSQVRHIPSGLAGSEGLASILMLPFPSSGRVAFAPRMLSFLMLLLPAAAATIVYGLQSSYAAAIRVNLAVQDFGGLHFVDETLQHLEINKIPELVKPNALSQFGMLVISLELIWLTVQRRRLYRSVVTD